MTVGQPVERRSPATPHDHDPVRTEQPQSVTHPRLALTNYCRQVMDAHLAALQQCDQQSDPTGVTQQPKDRCQFLDRRLRWQRAGQRGNPVRVAPGRARVQGVCLLTWITEHQIRLAGVAGLSGPPPPGHQYPVPTDRQRCDHGYCGDCGGVLIEDATTARSILSPDWKGFGPCARSTSSRRHIGWPIPGTASGGLSSDPRSVRSRPSGDVRHHRGLGHARRAGTNRPDGPSTDEQGPRSWGGGELRLTRCHRPCGVPMPPVHSPRGSGALLPSAYLAMKALSSGSAAVCTLSWMPQTVATTGAGRPG